MPPIEITKATDEQGRLVVEHSFGETAPRRDVRVTIELIPQPSQFQGSRLHILELVGRTDFKSCLASLIGIQQVEIPDEPHAIPIGHETPGEMTVEDYLTAYCPEDWPEAVRRLDGGRWWAPLGGAKPKMDLICKIIINGKPGLLFVEAKAHEGELDWNGKPLADDASEGSRQNHDNIAAQIASANEHLNRNAYPGFNLSIGNHYQLANRVTYLWKLANLGIPTLLLYLGFTGDGYFPSDQIRDDRHWLRIMGGYLQGVIPQDFPERMLRLKSSDTPLGMLIRSLSLADIARD
jgi:hypothetical protein